jgi:hypothetical protein
MLGCGTPGGDRISTEPATMRSKRWLVGPVTKLGQVTGEGLSDKAAARLVQQATRTAQGRNSLLSELLTATGGNRAPLLVPRSPLATRLTG